MKPPDRAAERAFLATSALADRYVEVVLGEPRWTAFSDPQLAVMVSRVLLEREFDTAGLAGFAAVCLVRMMRAEAMLEECSGAGQ